MHLVDISDLRSQGTGMATHVVVSHLLRLPSASPSSTRWPQAAMVVLCTSPLLSIPQFGLLGLQSVTCAHASNL